ncbi:outer membrane protein TolC [Spirosoma oryzae]|uniref:Outer membrane protein TolC n=1 Tax=Spirosoma oryzae TaxID=1469603 RepID=A0A2T0TNR3_9BACT|nr:TolC family protein [Spirosoma oryzae]PRY47362.1 outer membrane protein TolC [Spirosoma oryzae]
MSRLALTRRHLTAWLVGVIAVAPLLTNGQAPTRTIDTTMFPAQTFYEIIRQNHPIIRQAGLFGEEARQVLMQARGAFDPKLVTHYDRKEFGNDLYYDHWQNKLAVPIWPGGIDLNISYDRNDPRGRYINPEERTPPTGLTGVGLSLPIGKTMLIDARRNAVRQARLAQTMAEADRLSLVNKTLYDAAKSYWDWFLAHRQRVLLTEGFELANTRFVALRTQALLGEIATIDTTEALITVQDRLVQQQQAVLDERNARLRVNTFLWNPEGQPTELPEQTIPQLTSPLIPADTLLQPLLAQAAQQHPELLKLDTKIGQLTLEERWRQALVQPQIALSASLLSQTPSVDERYDWSSYYAFRPQNYKVGLDVVFPLFLRKERGKLREVQLKNQQTALERQQTGRDVMNGVQSAYNQLQILARQVVIQQQTIQNQTILVRGEQAKFELGESSLFLINSRESKLIDLRIKGEELKAKYQKAVAQLYYAAGGAL